METSKSRSCAETQESNSIRTSITLTRRLSFQETVCKRIDDNIVFISAASRSYCGVRMSVDCDRRRPITTIVELSPDQGNTSSEDLHFSQETPTMSLTLLAQGTKFICLFCF
ncbi:unnamed protein product [Rotaria sp. Silwood2]|nr:unnamed protein product [Rotaria sp. Silwood2]